MSHHSHEEDRARPPEASRFFSFAKQSDGTYRLDDETTPRGVITIGEGEIGGKARGLLFVMLQVERGFRLGTNAELIRFPDSTVLTTELFDTFMEQGHLEDVVQASCEGRISHEETTRRFLNAPFPAAWRERLLPFLTTEKRPLVVRSSSVMEDDPNHSFAGIYLSEFLPNRGSIEERLDSLIVAIRRVFASTFGANARAYRKRHGLDWRQERMALLIQNMIGSQYSHALFYPLVSGVAFSRNYYPWTSRLKPEDGVVRLVVGTGTRAVGREYARVFSPAAPGLRPEGTDTQTIVRYSQETVDVLDFSVGALCQRKLYQLDNPLLTRICSIVGSDGTLRDPTTTTAMLQSDERFVATFTRLVQGNRLMPFTLLIHELLTTLENLLELPVDIEFALDFSSAEASKQRTPLLALLQVRPQGARPEHRRIRPHSVPTDQVLLTAHRVLGNGVLRQIRHLVLVDPATYRWDRAYEIARTIGRINEDLVKVDEPYILIGPGRWASTNPQLGVPVQYSEISGASVLVEMATASFAPELSYGTHFYADMVGSGVLYLPFHHERGDVLHRERLETQNVVYRDQFVTYYQITDGVDVYVDGARQRGLIALRHRPPQAAK